MRLALSTAALPGRTPADVARACGPRGLAGIEVTLDAIPSEAEARALRALDAPVIALYVGTPEIAGSRALARAAGILEAPVVTAPGLISAEQALELAPAYAAEGATLLLGHGSRLHEVRSAAATVERGGSQALGLAWEIRPRGDDLSHAPQILLLGEPHLLHVRLYGGGPEQKEHDGLGIGDVLVQLALRRFAGAVALVPSEGADPALWARWAEGSRPAGCGTAAEKTRTARSTRRVELDVRPVEPKDRIDTVLGSYDSVAPGGTLHLVVDHDPECMRHLLTATQPPESFAFEYLERGPEVWRVDVVRRA